MRVKLSINNHAIGKGEPVYIIAELSANHNQNFEEAVSLVHAAKDAGADAVKIQTYTADTLTIPCSNEYFTIGKGTLWEGKNLHALYKEASTPWEWQPDLMKTATQLGLDFFSTAFDATSVEFLEKMRVPAYKIASFEITDHELLRCVAKTQKPMILSTGMASREEISEAIAVIRTENNPQIALLKCTSAYPALPEDMNLATIADMSQYFGVPIGLSDHTLNTVVPLVAVALGATIIEKHFTLSRKNPGPDSAFSLEPTEFREMADAIRIAERSIGRVSYDGCSHEDASRIFRRSLFAVENISVGESFTEKNIRSIRPGNGLPPKHLPDVLKKRAKKDIRQGTPLSWDLVE